MDGTEETEPSSYAERVVHENCDSEEDENDYVYEINAKDHYRIGKARAAHESLISDPDTLLVKRHYQLRLLLI